MLSVSPCEHPSNSDAPYESYPMPKAPKPVYQTATPPLPLGDDDAGDLTYADKLFNAADLLRGAVAPYDYKYIVLGLIFLKYVSDAFEDRHDTLQRALHDERSEYYIEGAGEEDIRAVAEDRDEYTSVNVFWVPEAARWSYIQARAAQPGIGVLIDDAMRAVEAENPGLKGILFKSYAATQVAPHAYHGLINLVSTIGFGTARARERDVLGRGYEYFIGRFAEAEGNAGGEILFIDARKLFRKVDRTHNELTDEHIARIAGVYHAWRGEPDQPAYANVPGFCRSATLDEVRGHGYVLTPGRYVGAEEVDDDGEPFEDKMARLVATLDEQFAESARLEHTIRQNLRGLGFSGRTAP